MTVLSLTSLTRISDLDHIPYDVVQIPKDQWDTGDYVIGEITGSARGTYLIETPSGRMVSALPGDHVIGAFGNRAATLEGVGSWSDIEDNRMNAMTSAGLFGAVTSLSAMIGRTTDLNYRGHTMRNGKKVCMSDFAIGPTKGQYNVPTILLVGTSMSAGKTTTGRLVVHELEKMGKKVVGTKLTGAGRYRDVLSFRDAGASAIFDFVDAGLPSTVVPESVFREAIRPLLCEIASLKPDVVVAEAGASPLEPYNGAAAIEELGDNICCTILCASDPYAVVGVEKAFGLRPDLVSGPATSTSAAIDLVHKLTGVQSINVMRTSYLPQLRQFLTETLNL
jgi:hypothetical protein